MKVSNIVLSTELNGAPLKWLVEVADYTKIDLEIYYIKKSNFDKSLFSSLVKSGIKVQPFTITAIRKSYKTRTSVLTLDFRCFIIAAFVLGGRLTFGIQGFKSAFRTRVKLIFLLMSIFRNINIMVVSTAIKKKVISERSFSFAKKVVHLPPNPRTFKNSSESTILNSKIVGVIANFYDPVKGAKFLINVVLETQIVERFEIFGEPGLLNNEIKKLTLSNQLKVLNLIKLNGVSSYDHIFENNFGIGFVPSASEGFGRASCEFICNNRVLVSTRNGGIDDIFPADRGNKYLVNYGDAASAAKILDMISQIDETQRSATRETQLSSLDVCQKQFDDGMYHEIFYT